MTTSLHPRRAFPWILLGATAALFLAIAPLSAHAAVCGDAVLDAGEDCDDGNLAYEDCCSSTCTFEDAGTSCADDGHACSIDECNGSGLCAHHPLQLTCSTALKGKLKVTRGASDAGNKVSLKLSGVPATEAADFGDPITSDTYQACIFGTDTLVLEAEVAPGGTCDGEPCWSPTKTGFAFKDIAGTNAGIQGLTLKGSTKEKTKLGLKGAGINLDGPNLPMTEPAMAQIVNTNTGKCFDVYFLQTEGIKTNTAESFSAKAGFPQGGPLGVSPIERELDPTGPSSARDTAATRGPGPNPAQVYVQSIAYGGTGCPGGTVGQSISTDRSTVTLIFDSFIASSGPGVPTTESRKNCQINLNLHIPQGWQYAIATVDYRGYVSLPAKVNATQSSIYYFGGEAARSGSTNFRGPIAEDYLVRDSFGFQSMVWSACNAAQPININTQVRIDTPSATEHAQITIDSLGGKFAHVLGLQWRRC